MVWRRPETGDRSEIGERQRIFSTVGEHSVLPCRNLYAVPDTVLLHMWFHLRWVRHSSAAQLVSLEIMDGTYESIYLATFILAGPVYNNALANRAALLCRN